MTVKKLKTKLAEIGLNWIEQNASNLFREKVQTYASKLAVELAEKAVMAYLSANGFVHCRYCKDRGGLRRMGDWYVCYSHTAQAANELRQKEAAVAGAA